MSFMINLTIRSKKMKKLYLSKLKFKKDFQSLKKAFYKKKILITGHTGFKGSWLTLWLLSFGAKVYGISKDIPTNPSHYKQLNISKKAKGYFFEIQNKHKLQQTVKTIKPDYIFHLAAQSIVKKSFTDPVTTWNTNLVGTMSLLESLRNVNFKKEMIVILITSDKAYKNLELKRGYRENDLLGGEDPYSASKGSVEILINSYIRSFFRNKKIKFGVARAGNVIGGGDWSYERLIPDCVKSWSLNKKVFLRNPNSTRPWQHVLEVLFGYLKLAYFLKKRFISSNEAFNFGPPKSKKMRVIDLVKQMRIHWKKVEWKLLSERKKTYKEARLLQLNSNKAKRKLKWKCILTQKQTIKLVSEWYKHFYSTNSKRIISNEQINFYEKLINKKKQ